MKYFIDFEATQYSQEIIEIGCVREDGGTFKSLIKPRQMGHITPFISDLTGITQEKLKTQNSSDEVFSNFLNWIFLDETPAEFYCYGSADLAFVKNNLKRCTHSIQAQAALSLIATNLTDFSSIVESHFRLSQAPSLKKVMEYYYPNDSHTCHDALSDADMLCKIHKALMSEEKIVGIPFREYIGTPIFKKQEDFDRFVIIRSQNDKNVITYQSLEEAVAFIVRHAKKRGGPIEPSVAQRKLLSAINNHQKYFGYNWSVELRAV